MYRIICKNANFKFKNTDEIWWSGVLFFPFKRITKHWVFAGKEIWKKNTKVVFYFASKKETFVIEVKNMKVYLISLI